MDDLEGNSEKEGEKGDTKASEKKDETAPMDVDQEAAKSSPQKPAENGLDAKTDENMDTQGSGDANEPTKESVEEVKKEKKIKIRKTPLKLNCQAQLGFAGQHLVNAWLETECQLKAADREEKDKVDARNALEELVYSIRDKLYEEYADYVGEAEKVNLNKQIEELEDWIYGDGEDVGRGVYIEKKNILQSVISPVQQRLKEFQQRPGAIDKFSKTLNKYQKILTECEMKVPESKYLHLELVDLQKMEKALKEGWQFFNNTHKELKDIKKNDVHK
jgi:molecular chaperone DnaK (HSP70)